MSQSHLLLEMKTFHPLEQVLNLFETAAKPDLKKTQLILYAATKAIPSRDARISLRKTPLKTKKILLLVEPMDDDDDMLDFYYHGLLLTSSFILNYKLNKIYKYLEAIHRSCPSLPALPQQTVLMSSSQPCLLLLHLLRIQQFLETFPSLERFEWVRKLKNGQILGLRVVRASLRRKYLLQVANDFQIILKVIVIYCEEALEIHLGALETLNS